METLSEYTLYRFTDKDHLKLYTIPERYLLYSEYFEGFLKNKLFKNIIEVDIKNKKFKGEERFHYLSESKSSSLKNVFVLNDECACLDIVFQYLSTGETKDLSFEIADFYLIPHCEMVLGLNHWRIRMSDLWKRKFQEVPCITKHILDEQILKSFWGLPKKTDGRSFLSGNRFFSENLKLTEDVKRLVDGFPLTIKGFALDLRKYNGKLVLGGGSVVSTILETEIKDYDLFFVGCTSNEALSVINDAKDKIRPTDGYFTENCWTFRSDGSTYQFIFRLYQNIDEILLGFDVDSSAIVYDGQNIILSDRSLYAFKKHVNVVDFTRMSPSYEYRLFKYYQRGFDIAIPNFDIKKMKSVQHYHNILYQIDPNSGSISVYPLWSCKRGNKTRFYVKNDKLVVLKGLSALIFMVGNTKSRIRCKVSDYDVTSEECRKITRIINPNVTSDDTNEKCTFSKKNAGNMWVNVSKKTGRWVKLDSLWSNKIDIKYLLEILLENKTEPKWRIRNPGEQISSTFHQVVYNDKSQWYNGVYYE
jgi:hypothetical protein